MRTRGVQQGDIIHKYELLEQIGQGAFGEVWRVRHVELGAVRALKIPTDPDHIHLLRKEGKIQFGLKHPNIVATVDLDTAHDPPWFVMEYVEGANLRKRLQADGKLPADEAIPILCQLLSALEAAHDQGVLHRDLKPENILITPDGAVKVTDFGLGKVQAQVAQSLILSGSMMTVEGRSVSGTFEYMSPEQRRAAEPDPRDDIWAVGVIACELLTGRRPGGRIDRALARSGVAQPLIDIIDKACEDPDYRYATAAEMRSAVLALLHGVPEEQPPSRGEAVRPAPTRAEAASQLIELDCGSGVEMKLILIPAGEFMMGSPDSEKGRNKNEGPQHRVTISNPFYMGVTQVTQAQWKAVMNTQPWEGESYAKADADHAASYISWDDVTAFCTALSKKTGRTVRLPTEAEWEYACRADTTTRFYYGDDLDYGKLGDHAWYDGNADDVGEEYAHPVGQKKPNAWGLYDMHGNVWEWCADWYADSYLPAGQAGANADARDPKGPASGTVRVLRGGSWGYYPSRCRASYRYRSTPGDSYVDFGFRVVVESGSGVD